MAHRDRGSGPAYRSKRCRCGHYPVSHMRVVPVGLPALGTAKLEPTGPCEVCGAPVCPRFHPAP